MLLVDFLVVLAVVGVIVYATGKAPWIDPGFKRAIQVTALVVMALYAIKLTGINELLPDVPMKQIEEKKGGK